jgi:hypothetical protein
MSREGEEDEEGEEREEADQLSADHRLLRPAAGLEKRNSRYNQWNRHVINTLFYLAAEKIYGKSTPSTTLVSWRVKNICGGFTVKKSYRFSRPPAWRSLTKLILAGENLIIPGQGEFG